MLVMGIDVGGTFTDVVIFDEETRQIQITKVPSTPADLTEGVIEGLKTLKVDLDQMGRIVHGTTVATNAILERKGAKTALIGNRGFRDHIEIGDTRRYTGRVFNSRYVRIKPFVTRPLRFEVRERTLYNGEIATPLNKEDTLTVIEELKKQQVESVAVCLLHSYINGTSERKAGQLLEKYLPDVAYSLSVDTVREFREFDRFSTTVLNAYIAPLLKKYLEKLRLRLRSEGYKMDLFYMISSGGIVTEETAAAYPIKFILSGPAGAVSAGAFIGGALNTGNIITYDMGGTSTDVCLIKNFEPLISTSRVILAFPIKTPQLDINTIGAGGGSIASVDLDGTLRVGPESAGSVPGPACYDRGGTELTVTDANLLLGRLGPKTLLSGAMTLKKGLSEKAVMCLAEKVKVPDMYRLAEGIIQLVVTNMCSAIREISIERGHDPREFVLIPMGGAGPLHSIPIVTELGIPKVVVPKYAGNFSAFGLLTSDLRHDYVRTYLTVLSKAKLSRIKDLLKEMEDEGIGTLLTEGLPRDKVDILYSLDMRYLGQSFELSIPVKDYNFDIPHLEQAFSEFYQKAYGYSRKEKEVELVNLRVAALGRVEKPILSSNVFSGESISGAMKERRQVYFYGNFVDCPVLQREFLPRAASIDGPAVIEEFSSTTVVFPEWKATVDEFGNLILEHK